MERPNTETYIRWIGYSAIIMGVILVGLILKVLKAIFIPLVFALFISFLYSPINKFFIKIKIPIIVRTLLLILAIFFLSYTTILLLKVGISKFIDQVPQYQPRLLGIVVEIVEKFGVSEDDVIGFINNQVNLDFLVNTLSLNRLMSFFANNVITILSYYVLTLLFCIFLFTDDRNFIFKLFQLFFTDKKKSEIIIQKIEKQLNTYILTKTFINFMSSSLSGFAIFIIGVDFPILSGLLIFTFGFIPNIGSVVAVSFPILICFLKFGLSWQLFTTIGVLTLINSFFGNYLEPKLMGYKFNLSPVFIIILVVLWGWIWGPIGMLLAVPITAVFDIIFKELGKFERTRSIINLKN